MNHVIACTLDRNGVAIALGATSGPAIDPAAALSHVQISKNGSLVGSANLGDDMKIVIAFMAFALVAGTAAAKSPKAGEAGDSANTLTQGMVQLTLKVGETDQSQVLEAFGAPNITTIDGQGQEVWVYDRQATVTSSSGSGFSIGMLLGAGGDGVAGGGGLGFGSSKSKTTQSQRSMTLIIKFGSNKKVVDFKSRSSSF